MKFIYLITAISVILTVQFSWSQQIYFDPEKSQRWQLQDKAEQAALEVFNENSTEANLRALPIEIKKRFFMDRFYGLNLSHGQELSATKVGEILKSEFTKISEAERLQFYQYALSRTMSLKDEEGGKPRKFYMDGIEYDSVEKINKALVIKNGLDKKEKLQDFLCRELATEAMSILYGNSFVSEGMVDSLEQRRKFILSQQAQRQGMFNDQCIYVSGGAVLTFSMNQALQHMQTQIQQFRQTVAAPRPPAVKTSKDIKNVRDGSSCTRHEVTELIRTFADYVNENKKTESFFIANETETCSLRLRLKRTADKKWAIINYLNPSKTNTKNEIPFESKEHLVALLMAEQKPLVATPPAPVGRGSVPLIPAMPARR